MVENHNQKNIANNFSRKENVQYNNEKFIQEVQDQFKKYNNCYIKLLKTKIVKELNTYGVDDLNKMFVGKLSFDEHMSPTLIEKFNNNAYGVVFVFADKEDIKTYKKTMYRHTQTTVKKKKTNVLHESKKGNSYGGKNKKGVKYDKREKEFN